MKREKRTQRRWVMDYLFRNKSIDRVKAAESGIFELPKRICELRELGVPIEREFKSIPTRWGNTSICVYSAPKLNGLSYKRYCKTIL
jgi:hypothetical protein